MYLMKIENDQPLLRNGLTGWTRPILDEKDNFFCSLSSAAKKYGLPMSTLSQNLYTGKECAGHVFRFAKAQEVQACLGDKVVPHSGERVKKPSKKAAKKSKRAAKLAAKSSRAKKGRAARTIHIDGPGEALTETDASLFEGHVFTGGPAVLILPGTSFRMERPTRDEFPKELRDACRWS